MSKLIGFISYSSKFPLIGETIERALKKFDKKDGECPFKSWKRNEQIGEFIISPIVHQIELAQCLVADITVANPNVFYEIGYAIGSEKKVLPIINEAIESSVDRKKISHSLAFDTVTTEFVKNSNTLHQFLTRILAGAVNIEPYPISQPPDKDVPFYLVFPPVETDNWGEVVSFIKKINRFKEFDPSEQPRLPVFEAIDKVSSSYGVVVPFLTPEYKEAEEHNLRASFVAGLAKGMGRVTLMIQNKEGPLPANFRDHVKHWQSEEQLDQIMQDFALKVFGQTSRSVSRVDKKSSYLSRLDLGSIIAEYEINYLSKYYVLTDAFHRSLRGDARVVVGRKGAGKTALFFQLRDRLRSDKNNLVLDLKPEGHQLLKFKEKVLDMLEDGTREHTLVAFWEYLLLLEVCYKIIETDQRVYGRDPKLIKPFEALYAAYGEDNFEQRADFSERLKSLIGNIFQRFSSSYDTKGENIYLQHEQVTEMIFGKDIRYLKKQIIDYLSFKKSLWLLFDNLDKGWSTEGISIEDSVIIRTLLDASRKLEQQIEGKGVECHTIIFIRNDVLKLLLEGTPDHGKETRVALDWREKDLLCEVLRQRFKANYKNNTSFSKHWSEFCVPKVLGRKSLEFFIDNSLMRPRFLLSLINHCKGFAINRGHMKIHEEDIISGLSSFSDDLLMDISLELRDVFTKGEDLPYIFMDSPSILKRSEIVSLMKRYNFGDIDIEKSIESLIWHSVIGVRKSNQEVAYIHTESYDMKRLQILMRDNRTDEPTFVIHPAFWPSLGIKEFRGSLVKLD